MLPVSVLPHHITLGILKKMNLTSWMRSRKTCSFLYDLALQKQDNFSFTHPEKNRLFILYNPFLKKVVLHKSWPQDQTEDNENAKFADVELAGFVFDYVTVSVLSYLSLSFENWQAMDRIMGEFAKSAPICCKHLQVSMPWDYIPRVGKFFTATQCIWRVEIQELLMEEEIEKWKEGTDLKKIETILQAPDMAHFSGLYTDVDCFPQKLMPLLYRFNNLRLWVTGDSEPCKNPFSVKLLLEDVCDPKCLFTTRKELDLRYLALCNERFLDDETTHFPELDGISFVELWNGKFFFKNLCHDVPFYRSCFFFETKNFMAVGCFSNSKWYEDDDTTCDVELSLILEQEFNP